MRTPLRTFYAALLCAVVLTACGEMQVRESEVAADLPQTVAPIVVGRSDRASVRDALGAPWLASHAWGFDVFRISDRAAAILVLIVPIWAAMDQVNAYVLVSYDERGVVASYQAGVVEGDDVAGRSVLASSESLSLYLTAGDVSFVVNAIDQVPAVLVSPSRRDRYLQPPRRPSGQCTVLVGCTNGPCETGITVDGGSPQPLPGVYVGTRPTGQGGREVWMQAWTAPVTVVPGAHHLALVPPKMATLEASADFRCEAGELLYAAIDVRRAPGTHWKTPLLGAVTIARDRPAALNDQPMVLWRQGTWLVPAEAQQ